VQIRVLRSIKGLEQRAWDALCPQVAFSHGWFAAIEENLAPMVEARHLLLEGPAGLLGILPCWIQRGDPYYDLDDRLYGPLAGAFRRLGLSALPALLAYSPLAHRTELFLAEGVDRRAAIGHFVRAMHGICRDEGLRTSGWLFTEGRDPERDAALHDAGLRRAFLAPTAVWENRFEDFESYRRDLGKSQRRSVRNELNRSARSGIRLDNEHRENVDDGTLARLHAVHYQRYQRDLPNPLGPRFFEALKRNLGDRVILHTARAGDELVSFSLIVGDRRRWHMFLCGHVADERSHEGTLFFNLNYYLPIREAIERGVERLDFGLASYEAKVLRGCHLEPVSLWLTAHALPLRLVLPALLRIVDRRYRYKHRDLRIDGIAADGGRLGSDAVEPEDPQQLGV
jgi:predicted N-acyltransferase